MAARSDQPPSVSPERFDAVNRLTTVARLLSTAVHDARNSLQTISGNAELIEVDQAAPERVRARIVTIAAHVQRISARLTELAALAKPSPGTVQRLDLGPLAEQAIGLRRSTLGRARITVTMRPSESQHFVVACPRTLLRVVANLLLNAERAVAGRPGAAITLSLAGDHTVVRLTVADNGPGVPPEMRDSIFRPWSGPDDEPGVGLSVARSIAARYGGTLDLDPAWTPGAAFVLTLPAAP